MDKHLLELYSDYLLSSFGATTATGLSAVVDGAVSHDQVTRFLSAADYTGKTLWQQVKPLVRKRQQDDGVLIVDDTIQAKPHTDENALICWHYDHSQNRLVQGINLLNCVYHAGGMSLPITYALIRKPILFSDVQTHQVKRKSPTTKNALMRKMLRTCQHHQIPYRYVLADSWFSAREHLTFIRKTLQKHFVVALKANRTVALSYEQKRPGAFTRIDGCELPEHHPVPGWIKGLDFPVLLLRQVFTNQEPAPVQTGGSTGTLYLACSDLPCDGPTVEAIYQKRWNVETFHKTLKTSASSVRLSSPSKPVESSHAALAKSPTRRVRTQSNHCFMALYAAAHWEGLRIKHQLKHFALRSRRYLKALRCAFEELQTLKAA